jgi:predicted short-subunit dehydrogenase-like oxidoreductase (DUF2520 family)
MTAQRERTERLERHIEAALTKPSHRGVPQSLAEAVRQLRQIVADDVTEDEVVMAAHRVRAKWRQDRHSGFGRAYLVTIEANCARWCDRS